MAYNLGGILTGGAAGRSDSISGLDPAFRAAIEQMMAAAPPDIASELRIMSAFRSPEVQAKLWQNALRKYGSAAAARKWVAPPNRSQHGFGKAIDWQYASDNARDWARANAGNFGLTFPLSHEPWHMELAGARGGGSPTPAPAGGVSISTPAASSVAAALPAETVPAAPEMAGPLGPLGGILKGLTGGRQSAAQSEVAQIQPSQIGAEIGAGGEAMQSAAALMSELLNGRRNRYGFSLTGMG